MTKKEVTWLIIRLIGLWCLLGLAEALFAFPKVLMTVSMNYPLNMAVSILESLIRIILFLALGIYFLKDGGFVFNLLFHESKPDK